MPFSLILDHWTTPLFARPLNLTIHFQDPYTPTLHLRPSSHCSQQSSFAVPKLLFSTQSSEAKTTKMSLLMLDCWNAKVAALYWEYMILWAAEQREGSNGMELCYRWRRCGNVMFWKMMGRTWRVGWVRVGPMVKSGVWMLNWGPLKLQRIDCSFEGKRFTVGRLLCTKSLIYVLWCCWEWIFAIGWSFVVLYERLQ